MRKSSSTPSSILALDREDLRGLPLSTRKTNLAQLLRGRPDGIFVDPFEQGDIGPDLFRAAFSASRGWCRIAPIARIAPTGRRTGSKVKNRKHPAMYRVKDAFS